MISIEVHGKLSRRLHQAVKQFELLIVCSGLVLLDFVSLHGIDSVAGYKGITSDRCPREKRSPCGERRYAFRFNHRRLYLSRGRTRDEWKAQVRVGLVMTDGLAFHPF